MPHRLATLTTSETAMCVVYSMSRHVCLTVPTMRTSKFGCSVLALLGLVLRVHNAEMGSSSSSRSETSALRRDVRAGRYEN